MRILHAACSSIETAAGDDDVIEALNEVKEVFRADHWIYITFAPNPEMNENFRFLAGCPLKRCLAYEKNHWYLNDPILRYAQSRSSPAIASEIPRLTTGQQTLMQEARKYGLADGFVAPAQSAGQVRVGVLYLAYQNETRIQRQTFVESRHMLRSLSACVLEWDLSAIRKDLLEASELTSRDLELLHYELRGFTTKEIASLEGWSVNVINRNFANILAKMGVANRTLAARIVRANGLIPDAL